MTISSSTRKAGPFTGTGAVSTFAFDFKIFSALDLYVVRLDTATQLETVLVLNTDYTASLNANQNVNPGGTITLTSALAVGYTMVVSSSLAYTQETDLTNQGGFYPVVITNALDKVTILAQQLKESDDRTLKLSVMTPGGVSTQLPTPAANQVVGWDNTGVSLRNWNVNDLVSVSAYGTAVADIFTGTGSQTDFALTNDPANINNLDVSIGGVTQVPGVDYTWTTGLIVTFTSAPPAGQTVLVRYMRALPQGRVDWASVSGKPVVDSTVYINSSTSASSLYSSIEIMQGGSFVIASGVTFTIDVPFTAPLMQVFSGAGSVVFTEVFDVSVEWWGAAPSASSAVNTAAIQAAIDSLPSGTPVHPSGESGVDLNMVYNGGGVVNFSHGVYLINQITVRCGVTLRGASRLTTILKAASAVNMINIPSYPTYPSGATMGMFATVKAGVEFMTLDGNGTGTSGIYSVVADHGSINDVWVKDFVNAGIYFGKCQYWQVNNITVTGCKIGVHLNQWTGDSVTYYGNNNLRFFGVYCAGNHRGIQYDRGEMTWFYGCTLQDNITSDISGEACNLYIGASVINCTISGAHFEFNPSAGLYDVINGGLNTVMIGCGFVAYSSNTQRFIKTTDGTLIMHGCGTQNYAVPTIRGSKAVVTWVSGYVTMVSCNWYGVGVLHLIADSNDSESVALPYLSYTGIAHSGTACKGVLQSYNATTYDFALGSQVGSDATWKFGIFSDGKMGWGDGTKSFDAFLSRPGEKIIGTTASTGTLFNVGSSYNSNHLIMDGYHLWVDASGRLRIKNGAPTTDTDGTIVGTQS